MLLAVCLAAVVGLGIAVFGVAQRREHERSGLFGSEQAARAREEAARERGARARAVTERAERVDEFIATVARLRFGGVVLVDVAEPQPAWGLLRFADDTQLLVRVVDTAGLTRLRRAARWGPVVVGTVEVVDGGVWVQLWSRSGPVDLVGDEVSVLSG